MASAHLTSSGTEDSLARLNFAAEQEVGINEQIKYAFCQLLMICIGDICCWTFIRSLATLSWSLAVVFMRQP